MFSDDFFTNPMAGMMRMDNMMDSMMMDPFGMHRNRGAGALMPFGFGGGLFPSMQGMFQNFENMAGSPDCHSFASSSVMTYTTDPTGRPQMYQASSSTRTGPGGVKETRRSVQDSRTGMQELAIGHHLHERGHVVEKKRNRYTGDQEENEEFVNLEDDEADHFENEWRERANAAHRFGDARPRIAHHQSQPQLAITDGATALPAAAADTNSKKKSGKHKKKHSGRPSPYQ